MKLFAEVYLDEDVDVLVATLLRARGFGAVTTREAGRLAATDEEQLVYATESGLVMLTHNRSHFEALHLRWVQQGRHHCGILSAVQRPPYELSQRLTRMLNQFTAEEFSGQLLYL